MKLEKKINYIKGSEIKKKYQLKEWGWIKIKNKLEGKKNSLIGGLNWKKKLTKGQKESQKNNDEIRKNKTLQI